MIENKIIKVLKNSIADELEIEPGDELVSVNGHQVLDYIDYKYQISDDQIVMEIKKPDGEIWELDIEKEYDEDLGIIFQNPLMDNIKVCCNKCIFCFVDQMPRGMRKTLYIKDDDTRLSFLYGNFITLTNLKEEDIDRIIKYRISPIKVSVHTTDLKLRNEIIGNHNGKDVMIYLKKLADGGITIDCQVVLCPGINDGDALDKTVDDLVQLYPNVRSVAVVPVGLTDYRTKLYKLKGFDKESSLELIDQITKKQNELLKKIGTRFVFISDEFFVMAESGFPSYEYYEDFEQLENGIGIFRLFEREIHDSLEHVHDIVKTTKKFTFVTGVAAYDLICKLANDITQKTGIEIEVVKIVNDCFGHKITVAGLVTGNDIINQLKGKNYENLIIPKVMVEHDGNVFLDDVKIPDMKKELNTNVYICEVNGKKLVNLLLKHAKEE